MGGKTQPRVAGNVKPSSSGRIRELLINKNGGGNIITFSSLSNNHNRQPEPKAEPEREKESTPITENEVQQRPANVGLVIKKVGDRDCFVRVKLPKEIARLPDDPSARENDGDGEMTKIDNEQPPHSSPDLLDTENEILDQADVDDQEPQYNFESLIDELTLSRESIGRVFKPKTLEELSEDDVLKESNMIRLLGILSTKFTNELSIEEWDIINRSIYKWIQLVLRADSLKDGDSSKRDLCVNILNFIHQLILLANSLKTEPEESGDRLPLIQALLDDWDNFYTTNLYQDLILLYFKLTQIEQVASIDLDVISALGNIVIEVNPELVLDKPSLSQQLNSEVEFDHDLHLPKGSRYCMFDEAKFRGFLVVCNLLRSHHRVIIVTAHSMLSKMIRTICDNIQATSIITEEDDIDNISILPPASLMSILTSRDSMMTALLSDYQVGDISVTIEPNSDSYSCTLAYLFVWDIVIQFIVGLEKEVAHCIMRCFKKLGLIQRLLDNVFRLVPPLGERDSIIQDRASCLSVFLKSPLKTTIDRPANEIELTALHLYFSIALHMPVTVRKWFNNNANKKLCNLVNEYTVKHISNIICSLEMENVQKKCQIRADEDKMNNLMIKARPNAKEVYAIYTRDEFKMELTIKLPINYPLGSVQIDGGKRVGVTDLKWRSWLLQLTTFLSHQNGPILDGVDLWRRNIDKRFEGIEKCMICFSILHSNYQLPKKKCQTCSKMFHNLCLYKWFESSGNSTCPLCRNTW